MWAFSHTKPRSWVSQFLSGGPLAWHCAEGGQTVASSVWGKSPGLQDFSPCRLFLLILGTPMNIWPLDGSAVAWWQRGTCPRGFSSRCLPCVAMPRQCCGPPTTKNHLLPARKGTEKSLLTPCRCPLDIPCHTPRLGWWLHAPRCKPARTLCPSTDLPCPRSSFPQPAQVSSPSPGSSRGLGAGGSCCSGLVELS